jgi:transposase
MSAPYNNDLRQKALDAVDRGERKTQVCRLFQISRNTLDLWLKRRQATGSLSAIVDYQRGPAPKIKDLERFREFAKTHGHLTQLQMAQQWSETISNRTIGKALKRIDFTRKKRAMATASATRSNGKPF